MTCIPDRFSQVFLTANAALEKCNPSGARQALEPIVLALENSDLAKDISSSRDFWRDAAILLRAAGLPPAAICCFEQSRQLGLSAPVADLEIGATLLASGEFEQAAARLEALAAGNPRNAVARNLYAVSLFEIARYADAFAEWSVCGKMAGRARSPFCTEPFHLSLATMALERFLYGRALDTLTDNSALVSASPAPANSDAQGIVTAAKVLSAVESAIQKRDFPQAILLAEEEIRAKGASGSLALLHAIALGELDRWREACLALLPAMETALPDPLAVGFYAYCLTQCGEPAMALHVLAQVHPAGPDDYFSSYFRGCALRALGDRAAALCSFQLAFCRYFFDTQEMVLLPAWDKVRSVLQPA